MSRNKRPREDIFDFNPTKLARKEEDSDSDGLGLPIDPELYEDLEENLKKVLNPLLPTFKKHLGVEVGLLLRAKLLQLDVLPFGGDLNQQSVEIQQLCTALVESWSGKEKKARTPEEKEQLRGKDALDEWEHEVIEIELASGLSYFPLKVLPVVEENDEDEEPDADAIPLKDLSIAHFTKVPYILASPDVGDTEKSVWERLNEECDGLMLLNTTSTNIMLNIWKENLEAVDSCINVGKFNDAFSIIFSTTKVMDSIEHWYNDFDDSKSVADVMKMLQNSWNLALAKSNEELGISGKENFRNDLKDWLDEIAEKVREGTKDIDEGVKFPWKLVI